MMEGFTEGVGTGDRPGLDGLLRVEPSVDIWADEREVGSSGSTIGPLRCYWALLYRKENPHVCSVYLKLLPDAGHLNLIVLFNYKNVSTVLFVRHMAEWI